MGVQGVQSNTYLAAGLDPAKGVNPTAGTVLAIAANGLKGITGAPTALEADRIDRGGGAAIPQNASTGGSKEFEQLFDEVVQQFQKVLGNNAAGTNNFTGNRRGSDKPKDDGLSQSDGSADEPEKVKQLSERRNGSGKDSQHKNKEPEKKKTPSA